MTVLAGIYSRDPDRTIPTLLRDAVEQALSRHPEQIVHRALEPRCFLLKADIGAFDSRAAIDDAEGVSFLVGEPLLGPSLLPRPRSADLEQLHRDWRTGNWEALRRARGVFAAAHYDRSDGSLLLTADKLALRQLFYWLGEDYIIFATARNVLERIDAVPKRMHVRGVVEINSFGYPFGDRTAFESIHRLSAGEVLKASNRRLERHTYWRWDRIPVSSRPVEQLADEAFQRFTDAVTLRRGTDMTTAAFLSGGLDSRAIVAALRSAGMTVHTFNFAPPGSQDQVFGAEFGRAVDTLHYEVAVGELPPWSLLMGREWKAVAERTSQPAERPGVVWSGDGGSVVLGHVYLRPELVRAARHDALEMTVNLLHGAWGGEVPRGLLRGDLRDALRNASRQAIADELQRVEGADRGRDLHLVLLHNDQRRHLFSHFEDIDIHRLEFQLPFFDSDFVASVLQAPVDDCLGHAFYMRWLRRFPSVVTSVPWQAYPGHVPCPLPIPEALGYQWAAASAKVASERRRRLSGEILRLACRRRFPSRLMRRSFLGLTALMYRYNIYNTSHVLRQAKSFYEYWRRADGQLGLGSEGESAAVMGRPG